jgi:FAD/FMN-containing dehydrogenase
MKISGWGKCPVADANIITPHCSGDVLKIVAQDVTEDLIPRGLGRSYGDSSLATDVVKTRCLDHYLQFDETTGVLTCESGVSLDEMLNVFVPRGWFLPVTPGTKFVTVGGAIACDIHGKNHHNEGSFSDHVKSIKIATVTNGIVECSRSENSELFHATCGGMGLTGIITEATLRLKPIVSSNIKQISIKANNLEEIFSLFSEHHTTTYSVAWIDCLKTGNSLGRSILMLGEHADTGELTTGDHAKFSVPFDMPGSLLNQHSIQVFNSLYYAKNTKKTVERVIHYESFFYPLDGIHHWNRMYGKRGFTQYQFVLPKSSGIDGMHEVLMRIAASRKGSFLAVLKVFGKGNDNYLSFPMEGYTLALDFKLDKAVLELLNKLDEVVNEYGGRIYMCKDSRMSKMMLRKGYSKWKKFSEVRRKYGADRVFNSLQSRRLGL